MMRWDFLLICRSPFSKFTLRHILTWIRTLPECGPWGQLSDVPGQKWPQVRSNGYDPTMWHLYDFQLSMIKPNLDHIMLKGLKMNWDLEWSPQPHGDWVRLYKALTDLPSEVGEDQILMRTISLCKSFVKTFILYMSWKDETTMSKNIIYFCMKSRTGHFFW